MSTGGLEPSGRSLALANLNVQRASRSFCRSWPGRAFPNLRNAPFFDHPLLPVGVALLGSSNEVRVDDLAEHGDEARRSQRGVEALEKTFDGAGPGELFSEQPDRARIRHPVSRPSPRNRMKDRRSWIINSMRS